MSNIVILTGCPSKTSRLIGITNYAVQTLQASGHELRELHVADLPAEDLIFSRFDSLAVQQALDSVRYADGVIVASPVYKASYSGLLKTFLDLLPQSGLERKVILPLFIGGTIAHLLSIDYALKPVLSVLGAKYVLSGVFAVDSQITRDPHGGFTLDDELLQRLDQSLRDFNEVVSKKEITFF